MNAPWWKLVTEHQQESAAPSRVVVRTPEASDGAAEVADLLPPFYD